MKIINFERINDLLKTKILLKKNKFYDKEKLLEIYQNIKLTYQYFYNLLANGLNKQDKFYILSYFVAKNNEINRYLNECDLPENIITNYLKRKQKEVIQVISNYCNIDTDFIDNFMKEYNCYFVEGINKHLEYVKCESKTQKKLIGFDTNTISNDKVLLIIPEIKILCHNNTTFYSTFKAEAITYQNLNTYNLIIKKLKEKYRVIFSSFDKYFSLQPKENMYISLIGDTNYIHKQVLNELENKEILPIVKQYMNYLQTLAINRLYKQSNCDYQDILYYKNETNITRVNEDESHVYYQVCTRNAIQDLFINKVLKKQLTS